MLEGFGGVSEYGITVRWDKNFLTLLHLTLARRDGAADLRRRPVRRHADDRRRLGATASITSPSPPAPAGRRSSTCKNNLIRGVRKASDFLMALQLTGAFKREALPNLQVRLPAVVIGGGLTAIDTATELMAYYPVQVEKTLERYEALAAEVGRRAACAPPTTPRSSEVLDEYLTHGRAVRAERAAGGGAPARRPTSCRWCASWGGVTMVYRKRMVDSPAYRLNHEEVIKALEEGIAFAENLNPVEAVPDARRRRSGA